jgi:small subunit ribosomal protein S7
MSRRVRPEKREIEPDVRYGNIHVAMFVNRLMYDGKKSVAESLIYNSFDIIEERAGRPGVDVFEQALQNVMPQIEVRPRRVGGATYQVPVPVEPYRQTSLAMRWLLTAARNRGGQTMADKLANEFIDAANNQGTAVKRRDDAHRMAEANRAFSHFRI